MKEIASMVLEIDTHLLKEFEESLDPSNPEDSPIKANVLGYGEISTVFEIPEHAGPEIAFKRMPLFDNMDQVSAYEEVYNRYHSALDNIGIRTPEYGSITITTNNGRIVLYLYQQKIQSEFIGDNLIHKLPNEQIFDLIRSVLKHLNKVWSYNQNNQLGLQIALDGQISNWALQKSHEEAISPNSELLYFDTSTPLMRENGVELLDVELLLKATPPFVRTILKRFYLQDIVDRYYDLRKVVTDLIANFYKEQRRELVPSLIEIANEYFKEEAIVHDLQSLTEEEIEDYYKDDASTWALYLRTRKAHRFIKRKVLRGYYAYILPPDIER